jgi:SAM-dependent methyltransferase
VNHSSDTPEVLPLALNSSRSVDEVHHLAHANAIVDLYERHATSWAKDRGTKLLEKPWLDRFRALLPPRAPILDIGCGCAQPIATYLLAQGHPVTGIDSSPAMIAIAKSNAPAATLHVSDMRTLALPQTFAGLIAWDSFFHLSHTDQRRMFPIFCHHAAPNAALMFTTGTHRGTAIGAYNGETLYHASLNAAEYHALLAEHGFEVVRHVVEDPECSRTVWLAQRVSTVPNPRQ